MSGDVVVSLGVGVGVDVKGVGVGLDVPGVGVGDPAGDVTVVGRPPGAVGVSLGAGQRATETCGPADADAEGVAVPDRAFADEQGDGLPSVPGLEVVVTPFTPEWPPLNRLPIPFGAPGPLPFTDLPVSRTVEPSCTSVARSGGTASARLPAKTTQETVTSGRSQAMLP